MLCQPKVPAEEVMGPLRQLVDIVMKLRSPTGGWPADLPPTPENLLTYVGEEIWELLEALAQPQPEGDSPPLGKDSVLVPMEELIPHLLWLLASSNYEVMRLLEGVRARIYTSDIQFSLGVVRLVPVLSLDFGETCYDLDLVTQAETDPSQFLPGDLTVKLVENDLDDRPMVGAQMLDLLQQEISQSKPQLSRLLGPGWAAEALSPFQNWGASVLRLQFHLAHTGERAPGLSPTSALTEPVEPPVAPIRDAQPAQTAGIGFTLDDFADVLDEDPRGGNPGILGDWLTFTDEAWVQDFLNSCACERMLQHLPSLVNAPEQGAEDRELACMERVYGATTPVQVDQALSRHTFVHGAALVADVWLRLRWYLAHCSEQVMQLMGGLSCRVLTPGRGWQRGLLYLRPVMTLTLTDHNSAPGRAPNGWRLDLGNGRLLPAHPPSLSDDAVIATVHNPGWQSPLMLTDLKAAIHRDIADYGPAVATLQTGTAVNLHRLEAEEGPQTGYLTLSWGFTLQPIL